MSEWASMQLANLCKKIGSGATPRGGNSVYQNHGIPLIRSQNVFNDGFSETGLAFINQDHADQLSNVTVLAEDNLLNITGEAVCRSCQAPSNFTPARVNQHVVIIRPRPEVLDSRYLHYHLISPSMQSFMEGLSTAGATRRALTKGMIENFEIPLPPLPEQKAIAHILGTLDDKIDLNRRMNASLEAMAQALFKSWFVDFDPVRAKMEGRVPSGMDATTAALFPDRLVDSGTELGEIPEGWEVKAIRDVLSLEYGKALKANDRTPGPYPVYGSNGVVGSHDQLLVAGPGIVVGRKGNAGTVIWADDSFYPIDTTFYVVPTGKVESLPYLFQMLRLQDLPSLAADSAVPGLNRNMAYGNQVRIPPTEVIDLFDRMSRPLSTKIAANSSQSQTLAALRDTLLPRLMSGELRVGEAEKMVNNV